MMVPSVARIVHYQPLDTGMHDPLAAIVTKVHDDTRGVVDLYIFPCWHIPAGRTLTSVEVAPGVDQTQPGRWNWPPRVP